MAKWAWGVFILTTANLINFNFCSSFFLNSGIVMIMMMIQISFFMKWRNCRHVKMLYMFIKMWLGYYNQTSNVSHTLVGNKIVDHTDVVGGLKHGLSGLLQLHLHSRLNAWLQWIGQRYEKHLSFGFDVSSIRDLMFLMLPFFAHYSCGLFHCSLMIRVYGSGEHQTGKKKNVSRSHLLRYVFLNHLFCAEHKAQGCLCRWWQGWF